MANKLKAVDVTHSPQLLRLAEEMRNTKEPCVLRHSDEDLAAVMPAKGRGKVRGRRRPTAADHAAFRSAAGGWKDVDTDRLIADIYADRRVSGRRPGTM